MSQDAILNDLLGELRNQNARLNFLERRQTTDTRDFNAQLNNSSSSLSRFRNNSDSFTGALIDFGQTAATGRARLQDFFSTFNSVPILGAITRPAAELMGYGEQLLNSYRDLTRSGAGFGGSLKDMMVAAAESRLGLENFNAMVRINASTFASAPGGIEKGISTFVEAQKKLMGEDSPLRRELLALGYTAEDTAVFLGDVMRRQGNMSVKNALDADQLTKATASYAMELDTVSKLTGKRKEQIADEIRKATEDAFFKRAQMGMDQTQKMLSDRFMAQATMLGPDMMQLMQLVLSGADPVGTPEYQRMMVQTQGAGQEMLNFARAAMEGRDANASLLPNIIKSATAYGNLADQVGFTTIATMKSRGDSMIYNQEMLNFANRIQHLTKAGMTEDQAAAKIMEEVEAARKKQLDKEKTQAAELANAEAGIRDFGAQLTIVTSNIFPDFIGALAALTAKITGGGSKIIETQQPNIKKFFDKIREDMEAVGSAVATGNMDTITSTIRVRAQEQGRAVIGALLDGANLTPELRERWRQRLLDMLGLNAPVTGTTPPATTPAAPPTNDFEIYYNRIRDSVSSAVTDGFIGVVRMFDPLIADTLRGGVATPAPRAMGGLVDAGSYLVGERGPEIVNLATSGDVINNDNLTRLLQNTSNQDELTESIDQLNSTNGQMLAAIQELVRVSQRTLTATRGLNGNLFAA